MSASYQTQGMPTAGLPQSMTKPGKLPFNVEVLKLTAQNTQSLKPITVPDIYDGSTTNFHEEGLYSSSIFGMTGTEERSKRFSYIDLKIGVFHPLIYTHLLRVKDMYGQIMSGKTFAKWNAKEKDFERADEVDGETGFAFFVKHFPEINFKKTRSDQRNLRIKVIEEYRATALTNKWLVIPAGLRDVQPRDDGGVAEDEINDMYRKILSVSNTVTVTGSNTNDPIYDRSRHALQMHVNTVYEHIEGILTGKRGFIQAKWGSRRIFNGTRNVISSMDMGTDDLDSPRAIDSTDTVVGLYQTAKGLLPKVCSWLRKGHLSKVFTGADTVPLVDRKTNKTVWVSVTPETLDRWSSMEGLEKFINYYGNTVIRHRPILIENKYLALVYKDDVGFRILNPGEFEFLSKERQANCKPITYAELLYIAGYNQWNKQCCVVTRYPITGLGSTYPSTVYLKTTVESDILTELDENFESKGEDFTAYEFPRHGVPFFDTVGLSPARLQGLGADHDGDTVSVNFVGSDNANKEIHKLFTEKKGYIDPRGGLQMTGTDTIDWLLRGLTYNCKL